MSREPSPTSSRLFQLLLIDCFFSELLFKVLQQSKGHERAQTLLFKSKQFKEKKEAAVKATNEARLEDAERIYSEAITIDPRYVNVIMNVMRPGHVN